MIKDAGDSRVGSENYCYSPGDLGEMVNELVNLSTVLTKKTKRGRPG